MKFMKSIYDKNSWFMKIDVTEIENQLWECIKFTTIFGWEEIRKNSTIVNFNERKTAIMHNKGISNIYYNWQNK